MNKIFALASITFREGIRNRSVFGVALFSLFILGLNIAVSGFFMRDIGKVTADMNLAALSFAGLLLVFFIVINLMAKDIDKRTIHLVLSKPITRYEYIFGKYIGIQCFVFASLLILFLVSCGTVFLINHIYPEYFGKFSWTIFLIACFFIYIKMSVLTSLVILFSTISSNSFITLVFSMAFYIMGVSIEDVLFYLRSKWAAQELAISDSLQKFMEFLSYVVPNFSVFDFKLEAAHGLSVGVGRAGFALGYAITYIVLVLILSSCIFGRREFN